ncbi:MULTISPECIES: protoporphyrinogen oxidase [Mycolicibacterium]|jgi:oxygen-dependent protoporphyrinogen oxidase|uniref:Coproporphyrinogen III oxidase n=1 Tax=Mycolicibacterium mucogenicum TaxID=56689 RepID=A0A1A0MJ01_MYCMU|nr:MULTISPECIES: protoporphyrinogen oxidase [Mycolicibacterium]OBA85395.1 protoporphyrinogen oxidase [Mycolicibacterium mucogenicum]GCA99788.1 protoporphyrinogen oxidase [Mycolicibacterium sp. NCC-Tsukiji]
MSKTYCVVGGGISGLVAAYRLRQADPAARITIFDPADRLGGVLRTERLAGQTLDVGAEAFVARRPEVTSLLKELGLRQIGTTGVRPLIYSGGRLHPMPEGTMQGIPGPGANLRGLVDDATLAQIASEPNRPLNWQLDADPTVAQLVGDRFGAQVVTRSVDPLLAGVYAGSAKTIGIRSAVPALAAALDRGAPSLTAAVASVLAAAPQTGAPSASVFGAVDGGYAVLLDELVRRTGAQWAQVGIEGVASAGRAWQLRDDEGKYWSADAVVLALPAPRVAKLLENVAPGSAAMARLIPVASAAVVALALPGGTPLPQQSGVLMAAGEALHSKAITLTSRKWGRGGNVELLRLSYGRFGDDLAHNVGDDRLLAWSLEDLRSLFGITAEPVDYLVQRWIDAMPQYGPGHLELVDELRAGLPTGLAVAGGYLDGIGVPACVASGTRAAQEVVGSRVAR